MWVARARGGMVPCLWGSGGFAPRVRDCCRGCVRGVVTVYLLHSGFMTLRSTWEEPKPNTHPSGRGEPGPGHVRLTPLFHVEERQRVPGRVHSLNKNPQVNPHTAHGLSRLSC